GALQARHFAARSRRGQVPHHRLQSTRRKGARVRAAGPDSQAQPRLGAMRKMPLVTPEHEFIRRSVREFVEAEIKPIANDLDRQNKEIPEHILKQMAELGYFGVIFPAEE